MMKNNRFPPLTDLRRVRLHTNLDLDIDPSVEIGKNVTINVSERLVIGAGSKIRDDCVIQGRDIEIGKNFVMNHNAEIGGGSCFEPLSKLIIGDNCHLGSYSIINTARNVKIGNHVGMGRFTNLYTHGAWLNPLDGFPSSFGPITIGNNVWIPSATILPDTIIGNNVVISEGAKIGGSVPDGSHVTKSGTLIEKEYPKALTQQDKIMIVSNIMKDLARSLTPGFGHRFAYPIIELQGKAVFNLEKKTITGSVDKYTEMLREHLRRNGIRFMSIPRGEIYIE